MKGLIALRDYPEVLQQFRWSALWELFDGERGHLNIAHECVDRHPGDATALRLATAGGGHHEINFAALRAWSSRFAHFLAAEGIAPGDRVAIMLEPSLAFYGALFGTLKRGAIAVPLFTLFGPEGLALRLHDCRPRLLLVAGDPRRWQPLFPDVRVIAVGEDFEARLVREPDDYAPETAADDLAVFQYTSGTTRALPEAVRHTHRAVVTLMVAALYGVGLEPGDRYFCPSSPAWGHGLWHGTHRPARPRHRGGRVRRTSSMPIACSPRWRPSRSPTSRRHPPCSGSSPRRGRPAAMAWLCARSRSPASPWTGGRGTSSSAPSGSRRAACTAARRSA